MLVILNFLLHSNCTQTLNKDTDKPTVFIKVSNKKQDTVFSFFSGCQNVYFFWRVLPLFEEKVALKFNSHIFQREHQFTYMSVLFSL